MAKIKRTCAECLTDYTITSDSIESVQYCPFCGENVLTPYEDDEDDDDDFDDDDDESGW